MKRDLVLPSIKSLVKPLARLLLRYSCSYQDFHFASKQAFVEVAEEEIRKLGKKVNASRLSVMTGMNRNDVGAIRRAGEVIPDRPLSVLGRVIAQWQDDKRFLSKGGKPRVLDCIGEGNEFQDLVHSVSLHAHASAVLFELERIGAIERTAHGAKLIATSYSSGDYDEVLGLLARDIDALISAVEENLRIQRSRNLHLHTMSDNLRLDSLSEVRKWLKEEGKAFHKRAREYLSQFDIDISPVGKGEVGGGRAIIGAFSLVTEPSDDEPLNDSDDEESEERAAR